MTAEQQKEYDATSSSDEMLRWYIQNYDRNRGSRETARYLRVLANNEIKSNIKPDFVKKMERSCRKILNAISVALQEGDTAAAYLAEDGLMLAVDALEELTGNSYRGIFYE